MALPDITEATIRQYAAPESFQRGREYQRQGAVLSLLRRGDALEAEVEGSEPAPYQVRVAFDAGGVAEAECSCPYDWGGWCKHIVAALLACIEQPGEIEERPPLDALLADLDRVQLRALLLRLVEREPRLADVVEGEIALLAAAPASGSPATAPASPEPAAQRRRTPVDVGAVRREVRALVRGLDRLRPSQAYWEVGATVGEVGGVLEEARAFIEADDGATALAILEAITEEYLALWEGFDDSDGEASGFFEELGPAWTEALLSADLTPEEREEWAEKLAAWQDGLDDYGVDEAFVAAIEAARQGWDYPPLLRVFRGEITERGAWEGEPADGADELDAARLNVLERRGRYEDYLRLAEAEGQTARYATMLVRLGRAQEAVAYGLQYLATTDEVLALAQALRERGEVERALKVGDHGLTLQGSKAPLATWVRDVAAAAGETKLALRAARIAFGEELSLAAYLRVQELAGESWPALRAGLLDRLRQAASYYPHGQVEIFLHEGLLDDAITAVDAGATHTLVEQVVDAALEARPDWVIKACRQQAESIMDQGKAQYYDAAARWLAKARAAYRHAGREAEWRAYHQGLLEQHGRKYKLVPLLKALR